MKKSIFSITVACALLTASFANAQKVQGKPGKAVTTQKEAPVKQAAPVKTKAAPVKATPVAKETKAVKQTTKAPASK